MKILRESKKGTKILLDNKEAFLAFTPNGIQSSIPKQLGPPSSEPTEKDIERLMSWIDDNNPYLTSFMEVMSFLSESDKFNEPDFKSRRDILGDN